jgi:uncharacterized protein YnzC (UPF0291/DUF896 family)
LRENYALKGKSSVKHQVEGVLKVDPMGFAETLATECEKMRGVKNRT